MRFKGSGVGVAAAGAEGRRAPEVGERGLGAALGVLVEGVARPIVLKAGGLPRFSARVEDCVYFCLATLLRGWPDGEERVLISVSVRDGRLGVVVFDPEVSDFAHVASPAGWEAVAGRVAALNGTLASGPNFGGLVVTIDVPFSGDVRRTRGRSTGMGW